MRASFKIVTRQSVESRYPDFKEFAKALVELDQTIDFFEIEDNTPLNAQREFMQVQLQLKAEKIEMMFESTLEEVDEYMARFVLRVTDIMYI